MLDQYFWICLDGERMEYICSADFELRRELALRAPQIKGCALPVCKGRTPTATRLWQQQPSRRFEAGEH